MTDEEIARRLDVIASILKLAHSEDIARARTEIRKETGKAAILDGATSWTAGGPLIAAAARKARKSERSIQIYVGELLALGVLEKRGAGRSTEYRATGVI